MKTFLSAVAAAAAFITVPGAIAGTDLSLAKDVRLTQAAPSTDDWKFSVGMPGWLAGLKGDIGVGGLTPVHVDVPFSKILPHLDMVAALNVEAQRGPWSFYAEGIYMKLSAGGDPPGPLLNSVDVTMKEVLAEAGVAYRLWEGKRGYFDLLAGARYVYMGGNIHMDVNSSGVRDVSRELADNIVNRISGSVNHSASGALTDANNAITDALATAKSEVSNKAFELRNNARNSIATEARSRIQTKIDDTLAQYPHHPDAIKAISGRDGPVNDALNRLLAAKVEQKKADIADAQAALSQQIQAGKAAANAAEAAARAAINTKVQSTKASVRAKVDRAVQKAERKLAQEIEAAIRKAIPQEVTGSQSWVDPFVGFRARYNFTDNLYLATRADIGGFGISSKLAWQAYGALGWQFNNHWSSELGYRYLSIDYEKGGFVYDAAMGGAFVGLKYTF